MSLPLYVENLFKKLRILLLVLLPLSSVYGQDMPKVELGHLDVSNWDFESQGNIKLNGSWDFYWNQLLSPLDSASSESVKRTFELPGTWNDKIYNGIKLPSYGYATFKLSIEGDLKNKNLALKIPDMYSSYHLWVDGILISENGSPGSTEDSTTPSWIPYTKVFKLSKDTVSIVLNISNFHHHKGGVSQPIVLGTAQNLLAKRTSEVRANQILIIGLALLSLLGLFQYFRQKNSLFLYFTLFSFTWCIRGLFTNMYLFNNIFPDFPWAISTKIEYLTLYVSLLLGVRIIGKMFPEQTISAGRYASIIINGIFIILTIIAPTSVFSKMLNTYFVFLAISLLAIAIIVMNAYIHYHKGAGYVSLAIMLIITLFLYDMASYYNMMPYSPYVLSFGYLSIYSVNGLAIWLNIAHKKAVENSKSEYSYY